MKDILPVKCECRSVFPSIEVVVIGTAAKDRRKERRGLTFYLGVNPCVLFFANSQIGQIRNKNQISRAGIWQFTLGSRSKYRRIERFRVEPDPDLEGRVSVLASCGGICGYTYTLNEQYTRLG